FGSGSASNNAVFTVDGKVLVLFWSVLVGIIIQKASLMSRGSKECELTVDRQINDVSANSFMKYWPKLPLRLSKSFQKKTQSESPLETGKEWEEKRAIQVLVQLVSKKYAATLNGAVGARKQQRLKNTLIFNGDNSESPLETGKEWEEKRAIQVLVQLVSKKYAATLNGAVGARKQQRLKNTLIFNGDNSESPLETGKEWEEKRAIQVLVQRKDPKEERYIVP
ncbi:hypothetical protein T4D_13777, partial [Trichinella pseudospiralis]